MSTEIEKPISEIKTLMQNFLQIRGVVRKEDQDLIIEDFLGAQLSEKFTHGISKFFLIDGMINQRFGKAEIIEQSNSIAYVDGNKELGILAARDCINVLCEKTADTGVAFVGLKNASRYSRLTTCAKMISKKGYVGIVVNTGGPAAVAPFGSMDAILGTNPICFSFPNDPDDLVIDLSTSDSVWGEVTAADVEGRPLKTDSFIDKDGNVTHDPQKVEAVKPLANNPKGSALCLAIELLAGALISGRSGLNVNDMYDLGFLFIAINPEKFVGLETLKKQINQLIDDVHNTRSVNGEKVLIPGESTLSIRKKWEERGSVLINRQTYNRLVEASKSTNVRLDLID